MPKRKFKSRIKIDSEEVQGEDSYVVIRRPTWNDFEAAMNGEEPGEVSNVQVGKSVIVNLVEDWNWVDDDDEPLPSPTPKLVAGLPFEELNFLIDKIDLDGIDRKN
jgi:hypothetical protein